MTNKKFTFDKCLVAVAGDHAAGGLGDSNTVIPYRDEHCDIVLKFLKAQLVWFTHTLHKPASKSSRQWEALCNARRKLYEAGLFKDKWMARTHWDVSINHPDELKRYEPYDVYK